MLQAICAMSALSATCAPPWHAGGLTAWRRGSAGDHAVSVVAAPVPDEPGRPRARVSPRGVLRQPFPCFRASVICACSGSLAMSAMSVEVAAGMVGAVISPRAIAICCQG